MKTMIVGDIHGNARWLREYIYPVAMTLEAEAIIQLGDFGAWEHMPEGVIFMDSVNELSTASGIPMYWLHGNHDKHSHTLDHYAADRRGFLLCRPFVFYIPQGHTWKWGGVSFRSFGGAYSVDRQWRLQREAMTGQPESLWFPEEEMSDTEMAALLKADSAGKDIIVSHDKPFSAKPPWNRKEITGCMPNQLRLEQALRAHKPRWWFHGHLHYRYLDRVYGEGFKTSIVGLDPDDNAGEQSWKASGSWALADLVDGEVEVRFGGEIFVDPEAMQEAMATLG